MIVVIFAADDPESRRQLVRAAQQKLKSRGFQKDKIRIIELREDRSILKEPAFPSLDENGLIAKITKLVAECNRIIQIIPRDNQAVDTRYCVEKIEFLREFLLSAADRLSYKFVAKDIMGLAKGESPTIVVLPESLIPSAFRVQAFEEYNSMRDKLHFLTDEATKQRIISQAVITLDQQITISGDIQVLPSTGKYPPKLAFDQQHHDKLIAAMDPFIKGEKPLEEFAAFLLNVYGSPNVIPSARSPAVAGDANQPNLTRDKFTQLLTQYPIPAAEETPEAMTAEILRIILQILEDLSWKDFSWKSSPFHRLFSPEPQPMIDAIAQTLGKPAEELRRLLPDQQSPHDINTVNSKLGIKLVTVYLKPTADLSPDTDLADNGDQERPRTESTSSFVSCGDPNVEALSDAESPEQVILFCLGDERYCRLAPELSLEKTIRALRELEQNETPIYDPHSMISALRAVYKKLRHRVYVRLDDDIRPIDVLRLTALLIALRSSQYLPTQMLNLEDPSCCASLRKQLLLSSDDFTSSVVLSVLEIGDIDSEVLDSAKMFAAGHFKQANFSKPQSAPATTASEEITLAVKIYYDSLEEASSERSMQIEETARIVWSAFLLPNIMTMTKAQLKPQVESLVDASTNAQQMEAGEKKALKDASNSVLLSLLKKIVGAPSIRQKFVEAIEQAQQDSSEITNLRMTSGT